MQAELKLKFDWSEPFDKADFQMMSNAKEAFLVLHEMDEYLRQKLKHDNDFKSIEDALEQTRQHLTDAMYERNISWDMLG